MDIPVQIAKTDDEQRVVFGWASVATVGDEPIIDLQGDAIDISTLEKAVYPFVADERTIGKMHSDFEGIGTIVESCVFSQEKYQEMFPGLDTSGFMQGWWLGVKIEREEVWKSIKDGELKAFSIGGTAEREDL